MLALIVVVTVSASGPSGSAATAEPDVAALADAFNRMRAESGLGALRQDAELTAVATRHAERMAARDGRPFHNPDLATTVSDWKVVGEVVGRSRWPNPEWVPRLSRAFFASSTHRAVLLEPLHQQIGLGLAVSASGDNLYVTAVLRRPASLRPDHPALLRFR